MNQRQDPHAQRLRPISLDVQNSTTVQITPVVLQKMQAVEVPDISPVIKYLIQLGKIERKNMIEQVQKISYDNRKNDSLNISVRKYDIDEIVKEFDQPVGATDDEPMTRTTLPIIEGQRTQEDEDDITQLQRNNFFYDL